MRQMIFAFEWRIQSVNATDSLSTSAIMRKALFSVLCEAQAAIAAYESAAAGGARAQAVADLRQRIRATSGDGTLATHVRGVVESDRSSAGSA